MKNFLLYILIILVALIAYGWALNFVLSYWFPEVY